MALSGIALARPAGATAAVITRIRGIPADFFPVDVRGVDSHVHTAGRTVCVLVAQPTKLLGRDPLPREVDALLEDFALVGGQAPEETGLVALDAFLA